MGALLTIALVLAGSPQHRRFQQRNLSTTAVAAYVDPSRDFLFATQSGVGMSAECAGTGITDVKGEAVTITRNSVAWCTKADFTLVQVSANQPRVMWDRGLPSYRGLLVEGTAAINLVIHNRDLSDASWTKTSMTCAHTAAGADLAANAASTCTATGSNATVAQTVTVAGARRNSSLYIKRRTGTGAVSVSRDNGSTYTDITASLSSSIFKRVVSLEEIGCQYGGCIPVFAMTGTGANPTIIVKIATSGDAVDIDLVQDETNFYPTSPITTVAASVTRPAESASITLGAAFAPKSVTWDTRRSGFNGGSTFDLSLYNDANNRVVPYQTRGNGTVPSLGGTTCYWDGASTAATISVNTPFTPAFGPTPAGCTNSTGTLASVNTNGGTAVTGVSGSLTGVTTVYPGGGPGGTADAILISRVCADHTTACAINSNRAVGTVAWIGDSIIAGATGGPAKDGGCTCSDIEDTTNPSTPPSELQKLLGRTVYNHGVQGDDVNGGASRFTASILPRNYGTLVYSLGTNNTIGGGGAPDGHAAFLISKGTLETALAAGMKVVATNILPFAEAPGFVASTQSAINAYNSDMAAWCATHPAATCLDEYTQFGGQGGDPTRMLYIYAAGDLRHISAAGATKLATDVAAANP